MPWEAFAKWIAGGFIAILAWLGLRLWARLDALEKDRVTREDFDELRHSMMATFTHGHQRLEDKLDRIIERQMK